MEARLDRIPRGDVLQYLRYRGSELGEELAVEISSKLARRMAPYVDGYFLITPFSRTELVARIMERIRADAAE